MEAEVTLPAGPEGARSARRATARAAELWRLDREMTETALLLVSELVTNAIRHGALPRVAQPGTDQVGGRGLHLVQQLALRWGAQVSRTRLGKTVWFELGGMLRAR